MTLPTPKDNHSAPNPEQPVTRSTLARGSLEKPRPGQGLIACRPAPWLESAKWLAGSTLTDAAGPKALAPPAAVQNV